MTGVFHARVTLAQASGPDIELVVDGDEHYSTYETPAGYSVVYDPGRGLYCYASVDEGGSFVSTGVPASGPPPPSLAPHAREAPRVRLDKTARSVARRTPPG